MNGATFPHHYIAIEGNIGAGKTTLSRMVADQFDCRLILEEFADNPFLPFFYENPERYAFSVELFFMTERHKQLQSDLKQTNLFQQSIVADYFFIKTLLFAGKTLSTEEFRLFQRLFHILNASFPKPNLLVYLHRSVDDLVKNIQKRGRAYEQDITPDYLAQIQEAYFEYFRTERHVPILILDVDGIDFISDAIYYEQILQHLCLEYEKGIHRVTITS